MLGAHFELPDAKSGQAPDAALVTAANLHVLQLEFIKAKLGPKWEKLSALVHTLFEKSLRRAQGPKDHFLLVDELSYVVTFHDQSLQEASLACAQVAKEACDHLFGVDVDDISIRSLVGLVSPAMLEDAAAKGVHIMELLERTGGEIIVSHRDNPAADWQKNANAAPAQSGEHIAKAHALGDEMGLRIGFCPVWELASRKSASLYLSVLNRAGDGPWSIRKALKGAEEPHITKLETALLNAAAEYAQRAYAAQKICSVSVGLSYETLSGFHSRIHYIGALKAVHAPATCPLLLRIDDVPEGTLPGRLVEIVTMLTAPNIRVTAQFESLRHLYDMGVRLGIVGIGGALPPQSDTALATTMAQRLMCRASEQKAFAFLDGLDKPALADAALKNHVRFGLDRALDKVRPLSGLEAIPEFPLHA